MDPQVTLFSKIDLHNEWRLNGKRKQLSISHFCADITIHFCQNFYVFSPFTMFFYMGVLLLEVSKSIQANLELMWWGRFGDEKCINIYAAGWEKEGHLFYKVRKLCQTGKVHW